MVYATYAKRNRQYIPITYAIECKNSQDAASAIQTIYKDKIKDDSIFNVCIIRNKESLPASNIIYIQKPMTAIS